MKGYEDNLYEADVAVKKLIEELDIVSYDKTKLMIRWVTLREYVENYWNWAHPHYKED